MFILDLFFVLFVLFIAVKSVSDSKGTLHNMGKFLLVNNRKKFTLCRVIFKFFGMAIAS